MENSQVNIDEGSAAADESHNQVAEISAAATDGADDEPNSNTTTISTLSVENSVGNYCRICQQQTEEAVVELGCQCPGELERVHRTCMEQWFRSRHRNVCEVCRQVATNAPIQEFTVGFLGFAALAIAHSMPWPVKTLLKVAARLFVVGAFTLLSRPMRSSVSTRNIGIALVSTGLAVIVAVLVLSFCRHRRRS
ncbi:hypothetical protein R1flu_022104 [Riccia fluitans]|uniref:RING-CH-type domain-containing protein n=1 Tax=Riccia fluitans TaxID=41844 RepID=A0ABD1ZSP7_9MARC